MDSDAVSNLFNEASSQAGRLSDIFHKYADYGVRDKGAQSSLLKDYTDARARLDIAIGAISEKGMPGFAITEGAPQEGGPATDSGEKPDSAPKPVDPPVPAKPIDTGEVVKPVPSTEVKPEPVENPVTDEEAAAIDPVVPINTPKNKVFNGLKLFVNPESNAADAVNKTSDPYEKKVFNFYAAQPVAYWCGGWNGALDGLRRAAAAAKKANQILVVVAYNIPNRDASGGYSAGGTSYEQYPVWLRQGLDAVGDTPCVWIVEPDALPDLGALGDKQDLRTNLIRNAVTLIKSYPNNWAYLDAGNYSWQREETMADRLKAAGIEKADGFALNCSGFGWQHDTLGYGNKLSNLLGGKHFVMDTSRNGAGPWSNPNGQQWDDWCNPPGRLLGETPRLAPTDRCDAFLWIKPAGQSDGNCKGGPNAGEWYPSYALELARNKVVR